MMPQLYYCPRSACFQLIAHYGAVLTTTGAIICPACGETIAPAILDTADKLRAWRETYLAAQGIAMARRIEDLMDYPPSETW